MHGALILSYFLLAPNIYRMSDTKNNEIDNAINAIQDIIGTDAGGRGMKALIVEGDLVASAEILGALEPSHVVVLTGFPCCVNESPPTETDGPPGALALARAAYQLGHVVSVVTDDCNKDVFAAAMKDIGDWMNDASKLRLECFPSSMTEADDVRLDALAKDCGLILACERAGPSLDGMCYTMRGVNMNEKGLIAPIHKIIEKSSCIFLAIGDGGNELGMGKVLDSIKDNIPNGEKIGCVIAADRLVAASVSNWGGYALAAGAALVRAKKESNSDDDLAYKIEEWIGKCLPTEQQEVALLQRCVDVGCRDGVSGMVEATVDGMPLATSMQALRDIRKAALLIRGGEYSLSCHCGKVKATFLCNSKSITAWDCNCSDCAMRRNVHFILPFSYILIDDQEWKEETIEYLWGSKVAKRRFCKTCGVLPFYTPRSNPEGVAITVGCVNWGHDEKPEILTKFYDGVNWENSYKATNIANETKK
jgi:D-glutamate cyclase